GRFVWWRPYGHRALGEAPEPMSRETIFDLASLTKVLATATSIMILMDRGQIGLASHVAEFIPEFAQNGKDGVTIEQLLRHRSGLAADNALDDYRDGPELARKRIYALQLLNEPGSRFLYSDVGYTVLGDLVERLSGLTLDEFASTNIFRPLRMSETSF